MQTRRNYITTKITDPFAHALGTHSHHDNRATYIKLLLSVVCLYLCLVGISSGIQLRIRYKMCIIHTLYRTR